MSILVKAPERIRAICGDIAKHFQEKVAPNGFGAQVVTFDRESCLLYKQELDRHLPPEVSDAVISVNSGERNMRPTSATAMPRKSCSTGSAIRRTR